MEKENKKYVFCVACSVAGGADRNIYHTPPACHYSCPKEHHWKREVTAADFKTMTKVCSNCGMSEGYYNQCIKTS